jgi:pyridoxal phosphate enzyme (YggS family)
MKNALILIEDKISRTCKTFERKASSVNFIAVSKMVPAQKIAQAIEFGVKNFGENYLQEAGEKWPAIKKNHPEITLHFIGNLQSNKVPQVVELFDVVQSLDGEKQALSFQKELKKNPRKIEFFIQVNIGEEPQKGGVDPKNLSDFVRFCRNNCELNVAGLMCVPPAGEAASPYFALLAKLAKENDLKNLSMGMSADFEEAIALGATHIRLGTAIFGDRKK